MSLINNLAPDENTLLEKTVDLYAKGKQVILFCEERDDNSKINPQIWKELRDAFDHLMRICLDVMDGGKRRKSNNEYYTVNLEKAHGHIYRATFDALDGASVSIKSSILKVANSYDRAVLTEVITDYWEKRKRLEEINTRITEMRNNKDVGSSETAKIIDEYIEVIYELIDVFQNFLNTGPLLDECAKKHKEEKKEQENTEKRKIKYNIRVTALVSVVTFILGLFTKEVVTTYIFSPHTSKDKTTSIQSKKNNQNKTKPLQKDTTKISQ